MGNLIYLLGLLALVSVRAANDWSAACLNGTCQYDTRLASSSDVIGSLLINGSTSAVSDITNAAGWTILNCDQNATAQDIRIVCTGDQRMCDHVHQEGTEGTIVRLPENCAPMPFARVSSAWVHENQTIPPAVAIKLSRRDTPPTVHGFTVDTNFSAVDPSKNGNVTFILQGTSFSGQNATLNVTQGSVATRHYNTRSFGSIIGSLDSFNVSKTSNLEPVDIDQSLTLFDQSISCPAVNNQPGFTGEVKVDVGAKAQVEVQYGLAAAGTIIPPSISEFALIANLGATLGGNLKLATTASGEIATQPVSIFEKGLPGLDFSGIFSIGPVFKVYVKSNGTANANVNLDVDLAYTINNARLFFPPDQGSTSGDYTPADTNLNLSVAPEVALEGAVEGHVIPTIEFGITVFGGSVQATINMNVDTVAKLDLSLQANATASTGASASGQVLGCADIQGGISVNAGADADFFNIFKKSDSISLFSKSFDIFKKCFGTQSKRAPSARSHTRDLMVKRGNIICPAGGLVQDVESIVNQVM